MSTEIVWGVSGKKKKACCDCGKDTTTKRCPTCRGIRSRDYARAYRIQRQAKINATRPPKKCEDCAVDILGRPWRAKLCFACAGERARKQAAAASAAWLKTPERKAYMWRYYRTPEYRAKSIARNRSPEMVAARKEYYQRPEVKARRKARMRTPEGKEAQRRAALKYLAKKKANLAALSEAEKEMK